jgi:threonylcarbamoyladenosine tRNA methylthiotransferase MtaB
MKIFLDTIGCRLNQAEIESMALQFRAAGHEIVASAEEAELAVINTCAVTTDAAADSRRKIRHLANMGVDEIVATGCWTTLQPGQAAALPHVKQVIPNQRKDTLVEQTLKVQRSTFDLEPLSRTPLPGLHHRTRAFIKVQDGCDNHCTFCITTVARGESRSRPVADVLRDIRSALAGGTQEIVLTGVHLGSWGQDIPASLDAGFHLRDLVKAILREAELPRLRLSSLEPWDLDEEFFALWADARLQPHLHLPLQSGCDSTLRRMARKTSTDSFRGLVTAARRHIPDVAITTDLIAGFPDETADEFAATLDFVREMQFAGGHVFTYSPRPGTGAARLAGQVRPEVRKERNHILRGILDEAETSYRRSFIGRSLPVLWESVSELGEWGWQMEGLTGNYLRVSAAASSPRWNRLDEVELVEVHAGGIKGVIRNP